MIRRGSTVALVAGTLAWPAAARETQTFVYRGAGCTGRDRMAPFERLIGRPVAGVAEFAEVGDWPRMLASIDWAQGCWAPRKGLIISQAIPMLLQDGAGTSLREGARGAYDRHFYELGRLLVARGKADAYLRIGWEFNGSWYPWAAAADPIAWKAYFRRIVGAVRRVPGQRFRIVWNPAQGRQQIAPEQVYPGDDVVDLIGLDLYNQSWRWRDAVVPAWRWSGLKTMPYGLDWAGSFAAAHRKPLALPEWGTGTRPDGHGGGDDPAFIANMARWIHAHDVRYHVYWDYAARDFDGELSGGRQPNSARAFAAAFGVAARTAAR